MSRCEVDDAGPKSGQIGADWLVLVVVGKDERLGASLRNGAVLVVAGTVGGVGPAGVQVQRRWLASRVWVATVGRTLRTRLEGP